MFNELIILLLGLTVHEFGHFVHYLYRGYNPRFIWIWVGPAVEPRNPNIPVYDVMFNMLFAIGIGAETIYLLGGSQIIMFAYIAGCFIDMANVQNLIIYLMRGTITLKTNINNIKVIVTK